MRFAPTRDHHRLGQPADIAHIGNKRLQKRTCVSIEPNRILLEVDRVEPLGGGIGARGVFGSAARRHRCSRRLRQEHSTALQGDLRGHRRGRLGVHERLIVADLAKRHGSSTTPVREVLSAVTRRCNFTLAHRAQVSRERRKLIAHIRAGEAGEAAALVARHVEGSGLRILEQIRAMPAAREMTDAAHEQA